MTLEPLLKPGISFYDGQHPAEVGLYTFAAVSRYTKVPESTVRWWAQGRLHDGYAPVLRTRTGSALSFSDLLEINAISRLRRVHGVRLKAIRDAVRFSEQRLGISRPLLRPDISTFGETIFIEHLGELVGLSAGGQVALRGIIDGFLSRLEFDESRAPIRFFPDISDYTVVRNTRPVTISPTVSFGRPTVTGTGIQTAVIASRVDAGERVEEVADDFGLDIEVVTSAIIYENAA